MSNLRLRLITAAIGLPLTALLAWLGEWPFAIAAGVVALLAGAEFMHGWLFPSMSIETAFPFAPVFGAAGLMVAGTHESPWFVVVGAVYALAFAIAGYSHLVRGYPRKPFRVSSWCLVYVGVLASSAVALRDATHGRAWFFLALLATFAVDTGAYTVGRLIGRHHMAPRISPGKTWEGAVGGYIAGTGAVFALNALFRTGASAATIAPAAALLPAFAIVGDLFESWMKRRMGVKDASGLLPGHGGFLDRLDSILFVFPAFYAYLWLRVL